MLQHHIGNALKWCCRNKTDNQKWLGKVKKKGEKKLFTSAEVCATDKGLRARTPSGKSTRFLSLRHSFPPLAPYRLRTTELKCFPDMA